ncbi:hypothetical protein EAH87_14700 [Sphingomonas koreensis]|nr:hypothetical protein EAH87_14700 [Sphingomonas koreensis]
MAMTGREKLIDSGSGSIARSAESFEVEASVRRALVILGERSRSDRAGIRTNRAAAVSLRFAILIAIATLVFPFLYPSHREVPTRTLPSRPNRYLPVAVTTAVPAAPASRTAPAALPSAPAKPADRIVRAESVTIRPTHSPHPATATAPATRAEAPQPPPADGDPNQKSTRAFGVAHAEGLAIPLHGAALQAALEEDGRLTEKANLAVQQHDQSPQQ